MSKLTDLKFLFVVVAVLEALYAFSAVLIPPSLVESATGWVLSADGHWITKLLGMALGTQAVIAWFFRKDPDVRLAKAFAFYQIASATTDWVMWLMLKDQGIFSTEMGKIGVYFAIPSHYVLGVLLVLGVRKARVQP